MQRLVCMAVVGGVLAAGAAPGWARSAQDRRWAQILRAANHAAQGRPARSAATLARLRRIQDTPALATASALARLLRGDVRGAQRDTAQALKLGGSYIDGHYWAAVVAHQARAPLAAHQALGRALTLGGDRPRFLMLRALLAKSAGQLGVARVALGKLAKKQCELLDPALYPDALAGLADTLLYALRRYPRQATVLFTMGNLMMMSRRYRQAGLYYQRAQTLQKQSAPVFLRRARLAMVDANLPRALRLLDRGLALSPGAWALRSARAEVLIALGRPHRARAELERVVKANSKNGLDLSRLADLLWDAGGFDRAERYYRYALRRNRGLASARYGVARALDRRGRYKAAERSYRAAAALSPGNERYHLALSLLYDKLARKADSAKARARAKRARALVAALYRRERQVTAVGTVARRLCRVAQAGALPAARLILQSLQRAPAVRGFASAYLAARKGRADPAGLAAALRGLKPARLLRAAGPPLTVLTVKGQIDKQVPAVLNRFLTFLNPDVLR